MPYTWNPLWVNISKPSAIHVGHATSAMRSHDQGAVSCSIRQQKPPCQVYIINCCPDTIGHRLPLKVVGQQGTSLCYHMQSCILFVLIRIMSLAAVTFMSNLGNRD